MAEAPYVRVVASSVNLACELLMSFLASRAPDVGGRPHRSGDVWQVELYMPEAEADALVAEGCSFHVDRTFFDRLQQARRDEEARSPSPEELEAILESGRFPGAELHDPAKRKGKP